MPNGVPFNVSANVKLNAQGAGTVQLGPYFQHETWMPQTASVSTSPVLTASSSSQVCQCTIYAGPQAQAPWLVDSTFSGDTGDSTSKFGQPLNYGNYVWAVWIGGPGLALATLVVTGTRNTG